MCRRQELAVFNSEFPELSKFEIHVHEPIELVPCANMRVVLLAPEIVPGTHRNGDVVDESHRILVNVKDQAHQSLGGQTRVGDKKTTRSDVVVREGEIEKAVNIQRCFG